ncbi:unnamed protein product [Rotaria socialis]
MLSFNEDENEVKVWKRKPPELSTLQPHALDVSEASDGFSIAIVAGYHHLDTEKTLPAVYLVRSNPPNNMTLVDNYILYSDTQKIVRGPYVSTDQFDCVLSVSIHDSTQQAFVGVPQLPRSTSWLDDAGIQAGLLLSDTATLPWSKSRIQVMNVSSNDTVYAYPNNRQTLEQWPSTPPTFLRLTKTYDYQLVVLTTDGVVVLIPSANAGYYMTTDDINVPVKRVWFGTIFVIKCPIETLNGAYFTYDTSLRNTKFNSALQLLATIKLNEETPIVDMLDMQKFAMTINFLTTGYTCNDVIAQVNQCNILWQPSLQE